LSRIREGTTMGGFICDASACGARATHSPVLCVPYKGYPVQIKPPMIAFVDRHACPDHFGAFRVSDLLVVAIRRQFSQIAEQNDGKPDFDRAYIKQIRCISDEYQKFQEAAGLVKPGDARADGSVIIPNAK
jgi:hypothetical protein